MKPWVFEVEYLEPFQVLQCLQPSDNTIFFDSSALRPGLGHYSYIVCDPFLTIKFHEGKSYCNVQEVAEKPLDLLQKHFSEYKLETLADFPGFQGGAAGFCSYDLVTQFEKIKLLDTPKLPQMCFGFYDIVIAFDEVLKKTWIFSSGFPEKDLIKRQERALQRYRAVLAKFDKNIRSLPEYSVSNVQANFTAEEYCAAVEKAQQYILAGDIFEVCLSQCFNAQYDNLEPLSVYKTLRDVNPAPFAAYVKFGELTLLSASPERFLKLTKSIVETRPIKGTSKRSANPAEDQRSAELLLQSEKDKAENAMIVDLLRNDLSKVCCEGSVQVKSFAQLESYATVHHLVSSVTATLKPEYNGIDLLKAAFPGGSITGAPKVRAMEIIAEIERNNRGIYCGNLMYFGFDGTMDSSILIRTLVLHRNNLSFQVGGAVVLDSDPFDEYQETLNKADALCRTLLGKQKI